MPYFLLLHSNWLNEWERLLLLLLLLLSINKMSLIITTLWYSKALWLLVLLLDVKQDQEYSKHCIGQYHTFLFLFFYHTFPIFKQDIKWRCHYKYNLRKKTQGARDTHTHTHTQGSAIQMTHKQRKAVTVSIKSVLPLYELYIDCILFFLYQCISCYPLLCFSEYNKLKHR